MWFLFSADATCVSLYACCHGDMSATSCFGKEGLILGHRRYSQSVMMGKAWQQEPETAGHVASTVRKHYSTTNRKEGQLSGTQR